MQPGLHILVGVPSLVAVGTPIPVIIISGITGALNYHRSGYVDKHLGRYLAVSGVISALIGAYLTKFVDGELILLLTAIVFMAVALRFLSSKQDGATSEVQRRPKESIALVSAVGAVVGFYSGFLGLGGGFLLVPALTIVFKKDMKTALGTSLLVIIAYAVPSAIMHFYLGHVDVTLALLMALGIVPGAYLGSRVAISLPDVLLRRIFGFFLFVIALYFAIYEARLLLS